MAVVSADVAESLRGGDPARLATFTASCAERMAQLFTGLRGEDPDRASDVDLFLEILNQLWDPSVEQSVFAARLEALEEFVELQPVDDVLQEIDDIYAFYGVLCMRYAVLCRATSNPENALECAHASLTALGQLDQNVPHATHFEDEHQHQRRMALGDTPSPSEARALDREVSHKRLLLVRSRL